MNNFDVLIIGGGLAGLSTAAHLVEKNTHIQVLVYEALDIASGASGVPGGIVNPVTGQRTNIVWNAEQGMALLENRLDKLAPFSKNPLFVENGVLRPAIDEDLGNRLSAVFKKRNLPKEWMEWIGSDAISEKIPFIKKNSGGLLIHKGKVVQTPEYLKAYVSFLESKGVSFLFGGPHQLKHKQGTWELQTGKKVYSAKQAVITTGYKSRENRYWIDLPIKSVKGQLGIYESDVPLDGLPAISAYGYIAPIDTNRLAIGSTYDQFFDTHSPNKAASEQLDQKLAELLPGLYPKCRQIGQWAGVRATTPDRLPLAGKHPEFDTMYIYTGLGSKGLLLSEVVANSLSDYILHGKRLPKEISIYRFAQYRRLRQIAVETMNQKNDTSNS